MKSEKSIRNIFMWDSTLIWITPMPTTKPRDRNYGKIPKEKLTSWVAGLGTGGTICGAGKYLKEQNPDIRLVAIEPENAPFISKGIFTPPSYDGNGTGICAGNLGQRRD